MRIVRVQERHPVLIHALLDIWERSVKATHLFLSDGEIENIKEYVPRALMGVENLTVAEMKTASPSPSWERKAERWKCCSSPRKKGARVWASAFSAMGSAILA